VAPIGEKVGARGYEFRADAKEHRYRDSFVATMTERRAPFDTVRANEVPENVKHLTGRGKGF